MFLFLDPETSKRRGLLRSVGISSKSQLTPKAKHFYQLVKGLRRSSAKLKSRSANTRRKLMQLQRNPDILNFFKDVNEVTANFFLSQQRTQKYKPRGRRFTMSDKILALSIHKQSGKGYRFLSKIFSLPSRKTLNSLLKKIPLNCGINKAIFNHLKSKVSRMSTVDKLCVLMFDEVSLEAGLAYNQQYDCIDGCVDFGEGNRKPHFADHAIVFMLKGIARKWKMPICFAFCEGTTPTLILKNLIKAVITEVKSIGLNVVATISDQGATNKAAINSLLEDTRLDFLRQGVENRCQGYVIDDTEIVHLYDFPHLMKGIRNSMLDKKLHFVQDGVKKVACWQHIIDMYMRDKKLHYSQFVKLTDEHVLPLKIKKMKVKNCTQVFSYTLGTAMRVAANVSKELSPDSVNYIAPEATDTASLLLFFDNLFDSVNGSVSNPPSGKPLLCSVTNSSDHVSFWQSCLPILSSMYYSSSDLQTTVTPSIKNWVFSLRSLIYLIPKLLATGLKHISPRCFNQDPLENFFSCIRSHGFRNTNPTCSSFISSYKSLLINNLVSSHSVGANCEADDSIGVLDNLQTFILGQKDTVCDHVQVPEAVFPQFSKVNRTFVENHTSAYVAGYVIKKVLPPECPDCLKKICTEDELDENVLIHQRQYPDSKLQFPSIKFLNIFNQVTYLVLCVVPKLICTYEIKQKIITQIKTKFEEDVRALFCTTHMSNTNLFIKVVVNIILFSYIKNINKILSGKDIRGANQDPLTGLAFNKLKKKRRSKV